jgi:hypothetical protein
MQQELKICKLCGSRDKKLKKCYHCLDRFGIQWYCNNAVEFPLLVFIIFFPAGITAVMFVRLRIGHATKISTKNLKSGLSIMKIFAVAMILCKNGLNCFWDKQLESLELHSSRW